MTSSLMSLTGRYLAERLARIIAENDLTLPFRECNSVNYTVVRDDLGGYIHMTSMAPNTVIIPVNCMHVGQSVIVIQGGIGSTRIRAADISVYLNGGHQDIVVPARYRALTVICTADNRYVVNGLNSGSQNEGQQ